MAQMIAVNGAYDHAESTDNLPYCRARVVFAVSNRCHRCHDEVRSDGDRCERPDMTSHRLFSRPFNVAARPTVAVCVMRLGGVARENLTSRLIVPYAVTQAIDLPHQARSSLRREGAIP